LIRRRWRGRTEGSARFGEEKTLLQGGRDLRSILRRLGFSPELLGEFAKTIEPRELAEAGWAGKLDRFIEFLWHRYQQLPTEPLVGQVAFFGTPGSGITTALCKELTASVFMRGEQPLVSSLDLGAAQFSRGPECLLRVDASTAGGGRTGSSNAS
jgi:hypothetical protein